MNTIPRHLRHRLFVTTKELSPLMNSVASIPIHATDCRHQKNGAIRLTSDKISIGHIANVANCAESDAVASRFIETWNALAGIPEPEQAIREAREALEKALAVITGLEATAVSVGVTKDGDHITIGHVLREAIAALRPV